MNRGDVTPILLCGVMMLASMTDVTMAGQCPPTETRPAFNGALVNVTIRLNNQLVEPTFQYEVTITDQQQTWFINFLDAAAAANNFFSYTATFYSKLGYFINSINNVTGTTAKRTYWSILDAKNETFLKCGVSSFVPDNNDVILFNFTTY